MPEHVGMEEALELLKKPRMGSVILAFKRAKYMPEVIHEGPHPKKKKEEKEHEGKIKNQIKNQLPALVAQLPALVAQ